MIREIFWSNHASQRLYPLGPQKPDVEKQIYGGRYRWRRNNGAGKWRITISLPDYRYPVDVVFDFPIDRAGMTAKIVTVLPQK